MEAGMDAGSFQNISIYPVKYAEMVMDKSKRAVELGAGLGRLLKHYHHQGFDVVGLERSKVAIQQLQSENLGIEIRLGDVRELPYSDSAFDVVLSFGVYHNLETGMDQSLGEAARVLQSGGRFCISTRPDNFEMRFNEWFWRWKQRRKRGSTQYFHRWLTGEREFTEMLARCGLISERVFRARNVSLLYRLPFLRARSQSEAQRRAQGYRLNIIGAALDNLLVKAMPSQFCNVLVFVGHKQ
jgi:SAM-dependent methyltransferase